MEERREKSEDFQYDTRLFGLVDFPRVCFWNFLKFSYMKRKVRVSVIDKYLSSYQKKVIYNENTDALESLAAGCALTDPFSSRGDREHLELW